MINTQRKDLEAEDMTDKSGRVSPLKFARRALPVLLVLTLAGCEPSEAPEAPSTSDGKRLTDPELVVAEDRLGAITAGDVDGFVLQLAPEERWPSNVERVDWYASIARRIAVDRLLFDAASLAGVAEDPRFEAGERRIERQVYSHHYLSELPPAERPSKEEVEAFYEKHREERYELPERRQTYHIFKRFAADGSREAALEELEQLRQRALNGEYFPHLARDHSDSESRHQDGLLGRIERGQFPADFDEVVFGLEEETPSEVVITRDGAHFFYVARAIPARKFSLEEVRSTILQELIAERERERLAQAAAELPLPEDSFTPSEEEIADILRLGDPSAVVLRLGNFQLSIVGFQEEIADVRSQLGGRHVPELGRHLYDEIRNREIIYQHLLREGLPEIAEEALERQRKEELIEYFARQHMISHLERQSERIQQHYAGNTMRFSTPVKVTLTNLSIPRGAKATTLMAELEGARSGLDAGRLTLETLAERHDGKTLAIGPLTATQLQTADPTTLRFAFKLQAGQHSPPYQRGDQLVMFRVDERQEAEARPLATIWDQVVQDYLTNYSQQLFAEVSEQLLEEAGFKLYSERLTSLGPLVGS